ncbi:YhjD/YihY/BrkB family envelope integrity protein [Microbacterium sp.]|uniref:YhjD/YihY/BrkB family envelope integrity protein n=1 Tax=Microbacterium sp. TaxID=51671 RepID=UPI002811569F|nr:YhjD/YihY/BrkB family envelope integrity protein [Microbacterium sp.]
MDDSSGSARPGRLASALAALIRRLLGWRLVRAALRYAGRRGPVLADAVTYRALFSVFAALLLGFSSVALWLSSDSVAWDAVVSAVDAALPGLVKTTPDGDGIVDLDTIRAPAGLSIAGVISLIGLVGAALGAIGSLRVGIRTVAGTDGADAAWYLVVARNLLLALIIAATFLGAAVLTFAGEAIVNAGAGLLGVPQDSAVAFWSVRLLSLVVVFALDAVLIGASFRMLSGVRAPMRSLLPGAALGALALVGLQELSGLFIGGARVNPLLASFASLLALLLWLNLSTQVILLASAFIATAADEERDRVGERYGSSTLAENALRLAEQDVRSATARLRDAQEAVAAERSPD